MPPHSMKRRTGMVLFYGGVLLALFSLILQRPSLLIVNGHSVENWALLAALGFALAVLGVVLVRKPRSV